MKNLKISSLIVILLLIVTLATSCASSQITSEYKTKETVITEITKCYIVLHDHDILFNIPKKYRTVLALNTTYNILYKEQILPSGKVLQKDFIQIFY